jgi:hypothetical protein
MNVTCDPRPSPSSDSGHESSPGPSPPVTRPAASAAQGDDWQVRQLGLTLDQLVNDSPSESHALSRFVELLQQVFGASSILWFEADATGQLTRQPRVGWPATIPESVGTQLHALAARCVGLNAAQLAQARENTTRTALAVPVFRRNRPRAALVLLLDHSADEPRLLTSILQSVQFAAAFAGRLANETADDPQALVQSYQTLLSKFAQVDRAGSVKEAMEIVADDLALHLNARWVAIGVRGSGGVCRLRATSQRLAFQRGAPLVNALETLLSEAMLPSGVQEANRDTGAASDDGERLETESVIQLKQLTEAQSIRWIPLCDGAGAPVAAAVAILDRPVDNAQRESWRLAADTWGPKLALVRQAHQGLSRRLTRWYRQQSAGQRRRLFAAGIGLFLVLTVLPFPHRVQCVCEIQAISRRYVAAPYEGRLEHVLVEPGDLVEQGQVLAKMDGREIRLELSGVQAEIGRVAKERDLALASGETFEAQIAELEMTRLQGKTQLLRDQLANLEIRSPSEGVVISGDPRKLEGARLSMGQSLLEVGPLGEMMVEVAIPDAEISYVKVGMPVTLRLESMPRHPFHARLARIHPRSEQRHQENIFVAEATLAEGSQILLPGMRGRAKIASGYRPLGWVLFHRALDQLVFRFGW